MQYHDHVDRKYSLTSANLVHQGNKRGKLKFVKGDTIVLLYILLNFVCNGSKSRPFTVNGLTISAYFILNPNIIRKSMISTSIQYSDVSQIHPFFYVPRIICVLNLAASKTNERHSGKKCVVIINNLIHISRFSFFLNISKWTKLLYLPIGVLSLMLRYGWFVWIIGGLFTKIAFVEISKT